MKVNISRNEGVTPTDLVPMELLRLHVRALDSSEDTLLSLYLESAIDYLQQQTNRILGESTVTLFFDRHELETTARLSGVNDITSIDSVQYLDTAASYLTLDDSLYRIHSDYPGTLTLLDTLPADAEEDHDEALVKIVLQAGTPFASLKRQYVQAALLLVGHFYNQREAEVIGQISSELKMGVQRLIHSARQF